MALTKRIRRVLAENKGRYIGILMLIFMGSFMYVTINSVADILGHLVSSFESENMQEDLSFSTHSPIRDIAALEKESGAIIDSYLSADVTLQDGSPLRLLSPCEKVNIPAVTGGRGLAEPGDILFDPHFFAAHAFIAEETIALGDRLFTVAGTMAVPHYIYILKNIYDVMPPAGFGIGLIARADFEAFPEVSTMYSVRFTDRVNINAQAARLHALLNDQEYSISEWVDAMNNKRIRMPWASISGMAAMGAPVSIAMFLLTCFIVSAVTRRMVKAESVIIGALYALGYRRRELMRHYLALPLLLAITGGVLGALMALPSVEPTVGTMIAYYNVPVSGVSPSLARALVGVLMPVVFLGLAGFFAVRAVLKKSAAELMKGDSAKTKVNFLERRLKLERLRFVTRFQLREQLRSIPRLVFLLLGVSVASLLMLFGFIVSNSFDAVLNTGAGDTYNFAIEYSFKEIQHGRIPEGAEPFNAIRCFPEGRETVEFYLMAFPPDAAAITLRDERGTDLSKGQVNITSPLARRLKLKEGDTIAFVNKLDGRAYSLRIDGIADTYIGQFLYMPLGAFNSLTGMAPDSYSGLLADRELDLADERLLAGVKDMRDTSAFMSALAAPMAMMLMTVTLAAAFIGMVIIFLVTSSMIEECRGTISLLKVFGYRGAEVARLVLNGATIVVIAGFALAFPVMLVSGNAMYGYMGEMINLVMPMIVNPLYVLVSFALIMLVYYATKKACARKLARIPMSEALKAE
jgi:putative ABC transport system permease protein